VGREKGFFGGEGERDVTMTRRSEAVDQSEAQRFSRRSLSFTRKGAETKIALADESTFARRQDRVKGEEEGEYKSWKGKVMMMGGEADGENGEPACCEFNADPIWVWDVFET
jgi:hypothetical protein